MLEEFFGNISVGLFVMRILIENEEDLIVVVLMVMVVVGVKGEDCCLQFGLGDRFKTILLFVFSIHLANINVS